MKILNHLLITSLLALTSFSASADSQAASTQNFRPFIVGGSEAAQGEFPFIVSLQNDGYGHFCGGSLIKEDWVLTAGHCAESGYLNTIVVGLLDQKNRDNVEVFKAKRVITHPQYNDSNQDYDFALIQLDGKSKYKPVDINSAEISIPQSGKNIMSTVAGWGVLTEESYSIAQKLMKVDVPLVNAKTCGDAYKGFNEVTDRMICAGYKEGQKDSCQGDSGGPLIVKKNGQASLIGVVSWGKGCARPNLYGVYSKVNSVADWIQKTSL